MKRGGIIELIQLNMKNNKMNYSMQSLLLISMFLLLSCNTQNKGSAETTNNVAVDTPETQQIKNEQSGSDKNDFTGEWNWEKNNDSKDFTVKIGLRNDSLFTSYCCIIQQGLKMDCPENDEYSFVVPKPSGNYFTASFKSYFSSSIGKVKLSLKDGKLIWEILEAPKGEFYCPSTAIMIKQNN